MIKIYTTKNCHYCKTAKDYFTSKGLPFEVFDIGEDIIKKQEILEAGFMSVPVIRIGDNMIAGFDKAKIDALLV